MHRPQEKSPGRVALTLSVSMVGAGEASNLCKWEWAGLTTGSTTSLLTMLLTNVIDYTVLSLPSRDGFRVQDLVCCYKSILLSSVTIEMIVFAGLIDTGICRIHDAFWFVLSLYLYVFKHCGKLESWHSKSTSITTYLKTKQNHKQETVFWRHVLCSLCEGQI